MKDCLVDPSKIQNSSENIEQNVNISFLKRHGMAFLILVICLLNLKKLISILQNCQKTKIWLPAWIKRCQNNNTIDIVYNDLRMEMRELSEQIVEFQRNSKLNVSAMSRTSGCHICRQSEAFPQCKMILKGNTLRTNDIKREINESNWVGYLNKYVFIPEPRIVDTSELEKMKRAYPNWFQY